MAEQTQQTGRDAIAPPETIEVETSRVACDGGGVLGHPLVYLPLPATGFVDCPYCDRRYILKPGVKPHGH